MYQSNAAVKTIENDESMQPLESNRTLNISNNSLMFR